MAGSAHPKRALPRFDWQPKTLTELFRDWEPERHDELARTIARMAQGMAETPASVRRVG